MSESLDEDIYRGFWTNWAMGRAAGATLTLSRRDGAYLIAFLALFVHITGASFWRLTSLVIFRSKATPHHDDTLVHQQQAVLRNSASAISGLRGFVKIAVRSRNVQRNLSLIAWSALNFAGFLAAGVLSSKVTSTQSDVLLKPTRCGPWWSYDRTVGDIDSHQDLVANGVTGAALNSLQAASCRKASTCYGGHNTISNDCTDPGRRDLTWNASLSLRCPFGDLCIDKTMSLDSGFVDSDLDLGINSPAKDRISLRLGLQCAPLRQDDYMKIYSGQNISSLFQVEPGWGSYLSSPLGVFAESPGPFGYEAFFYGNITPYTGFNSPATFVFNNGTIAFSLSQSEGWRTPIVSLNSATAEFEPDYQRLYKYEPALWQPVDPLVLPSRQVSLLFLSIGIWVTTVPIKDPWFRNNDEIQDITIAFGSDEVRYRQYLRQPYTTVLGCSVKSEMCHGTSSANRVCTSIDSDGRPHGKKSTAQALGLNKRQLQIAHRVSAAYRYSKFNYMVESTGGPGLLASEYFASQQISVTPIPDDQWTLEVQNWFASILVMLAAFTKSYVTGMPRTHFKTHHGPLPKDDEWMCHNQIIQSTDYASFNVVGLCVIIFVGAAVVVLNLFDERICRLVICKNEISKYGEDSWTKNELLELQATALRKSESRASSRTASFNGFDDTKTPRAVEKGSAG